MEIAKVIDFSTGLCYDLLGDSMYNQEIKERFLQDSAKNLRYTQEGFRKSESVEIKAGKDIAEMTKDEALESLKSMGFAEDSSLRSTLTVFKNYILWCKENSVFETIPEGFSQLKASEVNLSDSVGNVLFKDEADLLDTLHSVREFGEGYPEPPILCLAWLGFTLPEILELRDEDVDLESRTISTNGNRVVSDFSNAIADVLNQYVSCKSSERDHRTGWRQVIKDYSTGLFLKKMLPVGNKEFGKPYGSSQITSAIGKLNEKLVEEGKPDRIKFKNVWNSGRYYKLWQMEQSGIDVDSPKNRPLVEEVFRHSKSYYNAIRMYKAYKKAFDLA